MLEIKRIAELDELERLVHEVVEHQQNTNVLVLQLKSALRALITSTSSEAYRAALAEAWRLLEPEAK